MISVILMELGSSWPVCERNPIAEMAQAVCRCHGAARKATAGHRFAGRVNKRAHIGARTLVDVSRERACTLLLSCPPSVGLFAFKFRDGRKETDAGSFM